MASQVEWSDRALLWWEDNRRIVGASVLILLVAIVGWQSVIYVRDRREQRIRDAFAPLVEPAELAMFARDNPAHPLAGAAYLRLADQAFEEGKFAEAAVHYADAAKVLAATPFSARARLGHGMSLIRAGKAAEATPILDGLRDDATVAPSVQAEAGYQLAILHWSEGRVSQAKPLLEWVVRLEGAGFWSQRAQGMLDDHAEFR